MLLAISAGQAKSQVSPDGQPGGHLLLGKPLRWEAGRTARSLGRPSAGMGCYQWYPSL